MWWVYLSLGFWLGFIGTFLAVKFFPLVGLLDFPERYGLKRKKLPYPGGIVFLLFSFLILVIDLDFWIVMLPVFVTGVLSFIDDQRPIPAQWRLLVQLWLAFFIWILGVRIFYVSNPFGGTNFEVASLSPYASLALTVLWIVAIQNASNWFDGLQGLSVGISGIGFLVLGFLGIIRPELFFDTTHTSLTLANFYLAGLMLGGFWWYWKGKIILGDTGSQVIGFLLAVMAIFSGAKIATTLLVLGLPILDFFWVIFRRLVLEKKSPFRGDKRHFHHLLSRTFGEKSAVMICLLFSALFGGIALFLGGILKFYAFVLLFSVFLTINLWFYTQKFNS